MVIKKKITEMFAFTTIDEDGNEGVVAVFKGNTWLPLTGADIERIDSLRGEAEYVAQAIGKPVTLARFSVRQDLEVLDP